MLHLTNRNIGKAERPVTSDINRGQEILIRLRPHHSPTWFFDIEEIIGTFLHEVGFRTRSFYLQLLIAGHSKLTHNVHGPHDDKFYKFLNGLQEEFYTLQRTGYAGEGFHSAGHRLGGTSSEKSNLPPCPAREKVLESALKRKQVSEVLGGNLRGRTLGGLAAGTFSATRTLSPRELAARVRSHSSGIFNLPKWALCRGY